MSVFSSREMFISAFAFSISIILIAVISIWWRGQQDSRIFHYGLLAGGTVLLSAALYARANAAGLRTLRFVFLAVIAAVLLLWMLAGKI